MVAHHMANGHPPHQQYLQPQQPGHPGGQYPNPSPATSSHSLPGVNGSVPPQAHYAPQPMPYNGMNQYQQQHYQTQYPPRAPGPQYANYQYAHPQYQMGGPGPATVQNGFNAYQPNGYMPRQPVMGQYQQHQPGYQVNGHESMGQPHPNQFPPPGEGYYGPPTHPPPVYGQPGGQYQPNFYQAPPYPQQQSPSYPPGHPYSQGHGYGNAPPMHNGPNGQIFNGDQPPFQNVQHNRPPTKSLNPAARGFVLRPKSTPQSTPQDGHQQPAPSDDPIGGQTPTPASSVPVSDSSLTVTAAGNGNTVESNESVPAPVSQDGGLGLSQMEPAAPQPLPESTSTAVNDDHDIGPSISQASMSTARTDHAIQTPHVAAVDAHASPASDTADTLRPSPSPCSTVTAGNAKATFGGLPKPPVSTQAVPERERNPSSEVRVVRHRPHHGLKMGNTFNIRTVRTRPSYMSPMRYDNLVLRELYEKVEKSEKKSRGWRLKYLVSMGTGDDTAPRIIDPSMVFGKITVEEIPAVVIRSAHVEKPSIEAAEAKVEVATSKSEVAAPKSVPAKAKPASWAALLKPKAQTSSDTFSVGPSSVRVSPSKSIISLATDTDALTEIDVITPRSVASPLPPSTTAVTSKPNVTFNYASAAATGRGPSTQEQLVKLLTDGIKVRPKGPPASSIPRGLINTGNMCYANTILQMLAYCPPFSELLEELGRRLPADFARQQPLLEALITFLKEFAQGPSSGSSSPSDKAKSNGAAYKGKAKDSKKYSGSEPFIPENVYDALKGLSRFDALRRGQQEDAQEFLGWFIETLHEELLRIVSRTESWLSPSATRPTTDGDATEIRRPASPTGDWLEVGRKQKSNVVRNTETRESAVTRIFGGTLRSVLHAPGQKDSVTLEPFQPIQLDIQSNSVKSITDALRAFNEPEHVPEYRTSKGVVAATKQVFIETFPPVLILHLKRFVYDHVAHDSVKKNKPIAYDTELVIPSEIISPAKRSASAVKYRLFGVDYHHGSSASGGHYTIAVSRQDGKGWIHFDDETYSTIAEEDVVVSQEEAESGKSGLVGGREKCAYLLFYQRVR